MIVDVGILLQISQTSYLINLPNEDVNFQMLFFKLHMQEITPKDSKEALQND